MLRLKCLVAACILVVSVIDGNADTIGIFDVTGSFANPATTLTGTITVDETLATVTAADLIVGTIPLHFNMLITNKTLSPNSYAVSVENGNFDVLTLDVDNLGLATGGVISFAAVFPGCPPSDQICIIFGFSSLADTLTGGTFAPDSGLDTGATPLPAGLPLFATGLGALGLLDWRRKKKAAAFAA